MISKQQGIAEPFQPSLTQLAVQSPAWVPTIAQASVPIQLTRQGGQIILNGRSLNAPWSQRRQQIGIADAGLMQAMGVELLSSSDVTQQPVKWFSDQQVTPINLATWLTGQYRYLDITDLAARFGWQVNLQGSTLQITTPAARVTAVRQGPQTWGDRIVLDLDRAAPWQVNEERGEAVITLDAQIAPEVLRSFRSRPGNRLTGVKLEARGNQTTLRISYPGGLRPHVWSLTNPNRLLIDLRPDYLVERDIRWAPGIRWKQQIVAISSGRFPVVSLEIDPRQPGVSLKPILSNPSSLVGTAPLLTTAQRTQVAAAINGGFFNRNNQLPLGAIRRDNRWFSGPILNRGAIAWNDAGEVKVERLSLQETVVTSNGQRFAMQSTNSGFVGAGVARYTPEWGTHYTPIIENEILVTVQNNTVVQQQASGQTTTAIPADGYLLVIRADRTAANAFQPGTTVQVETATLPPEFSGYAEIVGAGPLLVQNRQIVLNPESERFSTNFIQEAAPRSVISSTAAGTLMLTTVHNRVNGAGPTLNEIAQIMQQLGSVNALNLDGGSSTTLYLGGQLLDRAPATAARVHNGIGVFIQPSL